jgi:hypothetical protein
LRANTLWGVRIPTGLILSLSYHPCLF